jgi:hypothetical protein
VPIGIHSVNAAIVEIATDARLEDCLRDLHRKQVVLGGFEASELLREHFERAL